LSTDETTARISKSTSEDIKLFMKRNPTFLTAASVIEYAVKELLKRGRSN